MAGIKNVFGGAAISSTGKFGHADVIEELYKTLEQNNCTTIDTATMYSDSEKLLGETGAPGRFVVDTKTVGGIMPGHSGKNGVIADGENSKKMLGVEQVDIWYFHSPPSDGEAGLEESLEGINELYKQGFFKRLGVSNFSPSLVQKTHDICKAKGYPVPQVFQGNYSPVARRQEKELFPTLRKLSMAFYAYSPLAGGFLTKTKQDVLDGKGRFDTSTFIGKMYGTLYNRPALMDALASWEAIAKEEGVSRAQLAYRWVKWNSPLKAEYGDALIVGASSVEQVKQTLVGMEEGPLSDKAVKKIDELWETIKHEAPLDNTEGF